MNMKKTRKEMPGRMIVAMVIFAMMTVLLPMNSQETYAADNDTYESILINEVSLNGNTVMGKTESATLENWAGLDNCAGFYVDGWDNLTSGGLPADGKMTIDSVPYQLACGSDTSKAYDGNDSIRLTENYTVQTMELNTIGVYDKIYVLGTAGGPGRGNYANFSVTLNYTDTTSSTTEYRLYDWYDSTYVDGVYKDPCLRRLNTSSSSISIDSGSSISGGPYIQSASIEADEKKLLKSITFEMKSKNLAQPCSGLFCGIYAITGKVIDGAPGKTVINEVTDLGNDYFEANWKAVEGATDYMLDVATDADFTHIISEYNNKSVGNVTSFMVTGLSENTTYYYRVRVRNEKGQGLSSDPATVTTLSKGHVWEYSANDNKLTAKCKGDGNGCYLGECGHDTDETAVSISLTAADRDYTGNDIDAGLEGEEAWSLLVGPVPTIVYYKDEDLLNKTTTSDNGADGDGKAPKAAGTYYAAISAGYGNSKVTAKKKFIIKPFSLENATVTLDRDTFEMNDSLQGPSVTVKATIDGNEKIFRENDDYTLSGNVSETALSDSYSITVTGIGNLTGTVTKTWKMVKGAPTGTYPTLPSVSTVKYTGSDVTPVGYVSVTGGTVRYQVVPKDTLTEDTGWTETVPTVKNVGEYDIWYKIDGDENHLDIAATKAGTFVIEKALQKMAAPTVSKKNATSVTLTEATGNGTVKYAMSTSETAPSDEKSWQTSNVFIGLTKNTKYYFFVKCSGDENYESGLSAASEISTPDVEIKEITGITEISEINTKGIPYGTEITPDSLFSGNVVLTDAVDPVITYSYEGVSPTVYQENVSAPENIGNYKLIIKMADDNYYGSYEILFKISKNTPNVPSGISSMSPTGSDKNDGKITGVDDTMEYAVYDSATGSYGAYQAVTGSEITGLAGGAKVRIRLKETETSNPGADNEITVSAYVAPAPAVAKEIEKPEEYVVSEKNDNSVRVEATIAKGNAEVKEITAEDIEKFISESGEDGTDASTEKSADGSADGSGNNSGENTDGNETEKKKSTITIDFSGAKQEVESVTITKKSVENISNAANDDTTPVDKLEVKLSTGSMIIDSTALESINEQADGDDIRLVVMDIEDSSLNEKQKEALKNENVAAVIDAHIECNGVEIHYFDGGLIEVSVEFDLDQKEGIEHYFVMYVADDGTTEIFPTKYENGRLIFVTSHLSDYVIIYDENRTNDTGKKPENNSAEPAAKTSYLKMSKIIGLGNTFALNLTNLADDATVKYTSSNKKIATVNKNGVITAKSIGKCNITGTVKQNGITYKFVIAVKVKETGRSNRQLKASECLTPNSETPLLNIFKVVRTKKPVKLSLKNISEDAVITCSSEDESIASVSADGTITGLKKGCTGINVYVEKNGQTCQYRVYVRVS